MLRLPVRPPLPPMLARAASELPVDGYLYEPKWDGFRALAFRDGEWADLQSRNLNRFGRYFPELVEAMTRSRPQRFVLDGEIVVLSEDGTDFGALLKRVHPARSRVDRLRNETPASFVAFDLLAEEGDDLTRVAFAERRQRLERLFEHLEPPLLLTPITGDVHLARRWLERFSGKGVDGVIAKARDLRYQPDRRVMVKVKRDRTADCVVGGLRATGDQVSSLLLGLYDDRGNLRHVGVSSSFTTQTRRELFAHLSRFAMPLEGHPWQQGFGIERRPMGRLRGAAGVWTPELPLDWLPVRPALVCEVAYNQLDVDRFRHPARFLRWRPDREPLSCRFDQFAAEFPGELLAS
jgi:ATP-dependent DNA ligase